MACRHPNVVSVAVVLNVRNVGPSGNESARRTGDGGEDDGMIVANRSRANEFM